MLIKELDIPIINALRNRFAHLMGSAAFNHVEVCPAVLGFGAGGGADEEGVFELALEGVGFYVVG